MAIVWQFDVPKISTIPEFEYYKIHAFPKFKRFDTYKVPGPMASRTPRMHRVPGPMALPLAILLPCYRHAIAILLQSYCHPIAILLPCPRLGAEARTWQ